MAAERLRRSKIHTAPFTPPISLGLLLAAMALVVIVVLPAIKSKREEAVHKEVA